jgi:hypothetical protein
MSERAELLKLHDWDELLFGGFYCLHCTPDDADDFEDPIAWPCQPLREAGVTDEEARALIAEHREKVAAEHQAEKAAKQAELQRRVDDFNARYSVGTPVLAYPGCRPEDDRNATRLVTRTRSKASVLGGHTDVVWVDGHSACIALSHVDVVTEDEYKDAKLAEAVADRGALPMPAGPVALPVGKLTEYAALDLAELMDADSTAIVDAMRARLIGEVARLRCELADTRHPTGEQQTEWGVQLADGGYTTPHRSREDADANLCGLRAHGESAYLVTRTVTHSQWEVAP